MIKDKVFLTDTDTTTGFVSQNKERLDQSKSRLSGKHYIKALTSLRELHTLSRIPAMHRSLVRRSKKTTFILPNKRSFRVIQDRHHLLLLQRLGWAYTTSANASGKPYDHTFALHMSDIHIYPFRKEGTAASAILKLGNKRAKRIR